MHILTLTVLLVVWAALWAVQQRERQILADNARLARESQTAYARGIVLGYQRGIAEQFARPESERPLSTRLEGRNHA